MSLHTHAEAAARRIVQVLQAAGHTAYFAGGCVRDQIMGRTPADYDVATSATPEQVLRLFPKSQKVGVAFGVVIVREKRFQIEVATFRADSTYSDGRRPDAVTFTTAEEDAKRRDFTCNGLFFDPISGVLHDFVGGKADISAKILRAIGDPGQRFAEDHLRLLRAVRFAAKLSFQVHAATWVAMQRLAPKITTISRERIGEELRMILEHPTRATAVELLVESGLLGQIWPGELPTERCNWRRLKGLQELVSRVLGLAAMRRDLGVDTSVESLRHAFMLSNEETADLAWLGEKIDNLRSWKDLRVAAVKRLLGDPRWEGLWNLYQAEALSADWEALYAYVSELRKTPVAPVPLVTGDDLIALGAVPGPAFKSWLERLYDRQLEGEFAGRAAALEAAAGLVSGAR